MIVRSLLVIAAALILASCAPEKGDLKAWLAANNKMPPAKMEAISPLKSIEYYRYRARELVDPFHPWPRPGKHDASAQRERTLTPRTPAAPTPSIRTPERS